MKDIYLTFLIILIALTGCSIKNNNVVDNETMKLTIYPFGGGDYGYNINLSKEGVLKTEKRKITMDSDRIVLGGLIECDSIVISSSMQTKIDSLIDRLNEELFHGDYNYVFDSWVIIVKINGKEEIITNNTELFKKFEKEAALVDLINLILEMSPMEIKMHSFS